MISLACSIFKLHPFLFYVCAKFILRSSHTLSLHLLHGPSLDLTPSWQLLYTYFVAFLSFVLTKFPSHFNLCTLARENMLMSPLSSYNYIFLFAILLLTLWCGWECLLQICLPITNLSWLVSKAHRDTSSVFWREQSMPDYHSGFYFLFPLFQSADH